MLTGRNQPEFIVKAGKPVAVILDLDAYEDMLKRLGDNEGIAILERVRSDTD